MREVPGALTLVAVVMLTGAACGDGTLGAGPDGGAGTSGTTGSGAIGGMTSGGGAGGADLTRRCDPMPPTTALITDLSEATTAIASGQFRFGVFPAGGVAYSYPLLPAPEVTLSGGALRMKLEAVSTDTPVYAGVLLSFDACVDASAYTGVRFTLGGTKVGACYLQFSSIHSENGDARSAPHGTCTGPSCSPSAVIIGVSLPPAGSMIWWSAQVGGVPSFSVDPGRLIGLQWQLVIPTGTACTADLTIDDVSFY
jgi:hypothetical protein